MKNEQELPLEDRLSRQVHQDRIFLNNPLIMQGMGLAPLIVVATSLENACVLAVAVALLLIPTRVIAAILLRGLKSHLLRAMGYTGIASVVYIGAYMVLEMLFGTKILNIGIYLPMLIIEPLIIYRFARVPEPLYKAVLKGLRMTIGYAIVLVIVGALRELLAAGTIYGVRILSLALLPAAAVPAGGFILVGIVCAIWRSVANRYRKYMVMKARTER